MIQKVKSLEELREQVSKWRHAGQSIAFVPTMGALHAGHLSLMRLAKEKADKVIASIFVNPSQFNEASDFDRYPRLEGEDISLLEAEGVGLVYLPAVEVMYPDPFLTTVSVSGITNDLEGASRPGHFDGVATVVTKLLLQALPDIAIFGEKDFQQLCLIKNMVRDLNIPVDIIGGKTQRDEEGLALSSRNVFLSEEGLHTARQLNKVLFSLATELAAGSLRYNEATDAGQQMLQKAGLGEIDYIELRTASMLETVDETNRSQPLRLLAAVRVDGVRLIDNVAVGALA